MTRYLSLTEFWFLAEHGTGIDADTLVKASRVDLADSALHAPWIRLGPITVIASDVLDSGGDHVRDWHHDDASARWVNE